MRPPSGKNKKSKRQQREPYIKVAFRELFTKESSRNIDVESIFRKRIKPDLLSASLLISLIIESEKIMNTEDLLKYN